MDSIMSLAFRARILLGSSEACPAHPCASPAHPSFMQRTLFVYPLSFHPLPHSFSQRRASNPFSINRLRTLSRSTEGGGCPPSFYPPVFRIFFQVPYALSPLFATLTKTAGVYPLASHSGTLEFGEKQGGNPPFVASACTRRRRRKTKRTQLAERSEASN